MKLLLVTATFMMSSVAFAQAKGQSVCFTDTASYHKVKSRLPELFKKLPVLLTLGGFGNASIKVMDDRGRIRIQSAVWTPMALTYGDEVVKNACFDGVKNIEINMWDGSDFFATIKTRTKVFVKAKDGSGDFSQDSLQGYINKVNYINNGAIRRGIKPAFSAN